MTNRQNRIIRVAKLSEQGKEPDIQNTTAAERISMMWQLAVDAWAFKGETIDESRLQRHIIHILRRKS